MRTWLRSCTRIWNRPGGRFALLGAMLLGAMLLSLAAGATAIDPVRALGEILRGETGTVAARILLYVRVPRTLGALLAGVALATSGALIQGVLNNALAGPNIIGVNAGAGFAGLLCAALAPGLPLLVPGASFAGALAATRLIYAIAAGTGASRITIVLAGVAVSAMFSAGIDGITTLYPDAVAGASGFMIGGLGGVSLQRILPALWLIFVGLAAALLAAPELNVLALGEETAKSLGMRVPLVRFVLLAAASILAGAAVSFAGLLGFVGLVAPHVARFLFGTDHRRMLPACAMLGGSFVLLCDVLARVLFPPFELPVGILMSLLGGPFFIYLLLKRNRGRLYD